MTAVALASGWRAALELAFAPRAQRTALVRRAHVGPLHVQRSFYPEADGTCHTYVLHPPGGVVGGDELEIFIEAQPGARCLITTPASGKFYRSGGATALQKINLRVHGDAQLEWLPQETLYFDGARVRSEIRVELDAHAQFIGWDIACLGRPASGERFTRGAIRQHITLLRAGKPIYLERAAYDAGEPVMQAAWGLANQCVTGTLLCASANDAPDLDALRERCAACVTAGAFAATQLRGVLVCRYLGPHTHEARACLERAWEMLRPALLGKPACAPRIWST